MSTFLFFHIYYRKFKKTVFLSNNLNINFYNHVSTISTTENINRKHKIAIFIK